MQQQGPNGMGGPLRGTSVWWHGRSNPPEPELDQKPTTTPQGPENGGLEDDAPMIRHELVQRVRDEIAAGDYDTPQRWEAALDRLLNRMYRD